MLKKIIIGLLVVILLVILAGIYKFNYLSGKAGYDVDGNKTVTLKVSNFEECKSAGYVIMESYPEQCFDGKNTFVKKITEEVSREERERDAKLESGQTSQIPDLYKNLKVLSESIFEVEISRSKKDCVGDVPQKCLQVKKEDGEWELFYDEIYGFNYEEGKYYVLKVQEKKYDLSKSNIADISDSTWKMIEAIKIIDEEEKGKDQEKNNQEDDKEEEKDLEMIVKIPRVEFSGTGIKVDFDEYSVPKSEGVLVATLEKLFEIRSATSDGENGAWNGLKFSGASIDKKLATVELSGSWFPAGDLSGFYFRQEVESAVMQFGAVDDVQVKVSGSFFDWCIDDVSDGEGGCPEKKMLWDTRNYGDEGIMMNIKLPIVEEYGKYPKKWKEYSVPRSTAVLTMTLKKFFEIKTRHDLQFDSVSLKNKIAKVFLKGDIKLDGDMSGIIFKTEMQGLVFQYPTVETLEVFVNDEILDLCTFGGNGDCIQDLWITNRTELEF